MVNGEQFRSQRVIGLSFTVHCLPNALRYAFFTRESRTARVGRGTFGSGSPFSSEDRCC